MDELVRNLARARVERQAAEYALAGLQVEFNQRPAVRAARDALREAEDWLEECNTALVRGTIDRWQQGQELHPAVRVKELPKRANEPPRASAVIVAADLTPWLAEIEALT